MRGTTSFSIFLLIPLTSFCFRNLPGRGQIRAETAQRDYTDNFSVRGKRRKTVQRRHSWPPKRCKTPLPGRTPRHDAAPRWGGGMDVQPARPVPETPPGREGLPATFHPVTVITSPMWASIHRSDVALSTLKQWAVVQVGDGPPKGTAGGGCVRPAARDEWIPREGARTRCNGRRH